MRKPKRPKYLKKVSIIIKDHNWDFFLYADHIYEGMGEDYEDSDALVHPPLKVANFKKSKINLGVIRHELVHILLDSTHVSASALDSNQIEELCCTIIQYDIHLILSLSEKIFNSLLEEVL